jgi:hypothetical protein
VGSTQKYQPGFSSFSPRGIAAQGDLRRLQTPQASHVLVRAHSQIQAGARANSSQSAARCLIDSAPAESACTTRPWS